MGIGESAPVQLVKADIMMLVNASISPRANCPAGVFELLLVHIDGYISPYEMFQTSRMVQVKMSHDDGSDVSYIVARCSNRRW